MKKNIKSSVRDDFKTGLQNIMKEKHAEFAEGTLEDNMVDIYDNYVSQYYEEELKEEGGEAVAEDWFRNTYPDDEENIFKHDKIESSRKPIKSYIEEGSKIRSKNDGKIYEVIKITDIGDGLESFKILEDGKSIHYAQNITGDALDANFDEITSSKKPIKSGFYDDGEVHGTENWKGRENNWRGVPEVHMIWHGEWSDPELEYDGKVSNYYDIENTMYEWAQDDGIDADNEEEFSKYCQEHSFDVYSLFNSRRNNMRKAIKSADEEIIEDEETITGDFEIGDEVVVNDESKDLNEVEGTVTDIVDDKAEVVFKSGEDAWVDLENIESACHGKSKKDKKKKPIKSADKHYEYDEYFGNIYDSDETNKDYWTREEYDEMVEKARDIFYPAVQKAASACHFTVSDNEAEYVAEKCVRCFFDNTSWDEAVNRPEEYYVNSSKKGIRR